ncbi:MAG: DUF1599 domain-containing protein, partial [Bacteroidota bacterium]
FSKKHQDYGSAWRILRLASITDQIYIKAQRIRSIQEAGTQKIEESVTAEFVGIINYCLIALMQMQLSTHTEMELSLEVVSEQYDQEAEETLHLLLAKNHDYGEAWRQMRVSSMTDLILMKIHRIKQIEDNQGKTIASEGIDANYRDILNYAVFCLIRMEFLANEYTQ